MERIVDVYINVVILFWLIFAVWDWQCHRRARIANTTGVRESILHLVLVGLGAVIVLMWLLCDITGFALVLMFTVLAIHEIVVTWDLEIAHGHRDVTAVEQRVHDYLTAVPILTVSLIAVIHWQQLLGIFGAGPDPLEGALRWRDPPLAPFDLAARLAAMAIFGLLPYCEELWRCVSVRVK